ncbi:glycine-rich cell wall structural protein-like [Homalodisca vitripennis]|uniref:glycine-rich cell wall structural protein-like n=1 Tax=Homalodisca vitripennis TaxID=197043 RepID=UPI001EEC2BD8|nr:glycine-rich cell wall structural protein-like [Homalodisca vitripennis]
MHIKTVLVFAVIAAVDVYGSHSHYHGPIAIPHVLHNGYLADTHEVAAAKSAHLAALATQSHGHGYGGGYGYGGAYGYGGGYGYEGSNGYGGGHGYNQDEVYSGSYGGHGDFRYHGPIAIPHVLHNGHIADTHEVAAAKAEHFAAVAKAKAHAGYGQDYSGRYAGGYGEYTGAYSGAHYVVPYHGPLAKPVVLKSGYLADTHEVAAAKHHHLEALHKASYYGHQHHHY